MKIKIRHLIYEKIKQLIAKCKFTSPSEQIEIPVFYYITRPNFGDILNEDLIKFFHLNCYPEDPQNARMLCIGSLLQEYLLPQNANTVPIHVFGSGFIKPAVSEDEQFCRPMIFHAVRGKLSLERCEKITGENLGHLALGDPALLIRRMFPKVKRNPVYDVGIICHYVDKTSPLLDNILLEKKSIHFIDVAQETPDFIREVAQCKFILSSAMHGLICADSLGIPNKHVVLSDKVVGGEYKFRDYYSVFEDFEYRPVYLKETIIRDEDIEKYLSEYTIKSKEIEKICKNLIKAFPKNGELQ